MYKSFNQGLNQGRSIEEHNLQYQPPHHQTTKPHHQRIEPLDEANASPLLKEFRYNQKKFTSLVEFRHHFIEFSKDRFGSRFIQKALESCSEEEREMVIMFD